MPVWPISKNPVAPELAARMPERQETIRIVNEMKRTVWGEYAKNNDDVKWAYHPVAAYCPNCEERVVTVVDHKWGNYTTDMLILSFFSFFFCLCFFPMCVNSFKDVQHFCPNKADGCGFLLGTYER
uniref:LITAF domain-containing protein n=1 Tax=Ditylenchus dipsaci TaxID=166011 RepID=A0A915CNE6_9BILA